MKLDIRIQNFGKINDAQLKIRPFTVIAGPNSSGKSFVTKSLYSFFSTINTDHVSLAVFSKINALQGLYRDIEILTHAPSSLVQ